MSSTSAMVAMIVWDTLTFHIEGFEKKQGSSNLSQDKTRIFPILPNLCSFNIIWNERDFVSQKLKNCLPTDWKTSNVLAGSCWYTLLKLRMSRVDKMTNPNELNYNVEEVAPKRGWQQRVGGIEPI